MWNRAANNAGTFTEHAWAFSNALLHFHTFVNLATAQCIHSLLVLAAGQLYCNSWELSALRRGVTYYWLISLPRVSCSVLGIQMINVSLPVTSNLTNLCFFCHTHLGQPPFVKHELFLFCPQYRSTSQSILLPKSLEQIRLPNCQLLYKTQSLSCHPQSHVPWDTCHRKIERQWTKGLLTRTLFFMQNETWNIVVFVHWN